MKSSYLALLAAMALPGCGFLFFGAGQEIDRSTHVQALRVETTPPGAQIYTDNGLGELQYVGESPTTYEHKYKARTSLVGSNLLLLGLGSLLDVGAASGALYWHTRRDEGERSTTSLIALGLTAGAVLVDLGLIPVLASSYSEEVAAVPFIAQLPEHANAYATVSMPGGPTVLTMTLFPGTPTYSAAQLAQHKVPKRALGKMIVLDTRMGAGVQASFGPAVTSLTLGELQRYNKNEVLGVADLSALANYEALRDMLACNSSTCFVELGGAVGADLIVVGDAALTGSSLVLTYRLVDTKRAAIVARATHSIPAQGGIDDALARGVPEVISRLVLEL